MFIKQLTESNKKDLKVKLSDVQLFESLLLPFHLLKHKASFKHDHDAKFWLHMFISVTNKDCPVNNLTV